MKKGGGHITAFYLETLLLILVFIAIILVLTSVFGMARTQSGDAALLTSAVSLAGNAAEAVSASDSPETLVRRIDLFGEGAEILSDAGPTTVRARFGRDMTPDPAGELVLDVTWEPEETAAGTLVASTVTVRRSGADEEVCSLETAVFLEGGGT